MERRKIQEVTSGTFTVSLPREWAADAGVSRGDVVDLHTRADGALVVQPKDCDADPTGAVTITLAGTGTDHVRQAIWAAYTAGYTEITLTSEDPFARAQRRAADRTANALAGATVTTTADQRIVIRVLLDSAAVSPRQLVRRLSSVALSTYERAVAAATDDPADPEVTDRDARADRLFAAAERSLTRALSRVSEADSLDATRPELFALRSTARQLERVADDADRIGALADDVAQSPGAVQTATLQGLATRARDVVDRAVTGVLDGRRDAVRAALALRTSVRDEAAAVDRRLLEESAVDPRLVRVLDTVRRTAERGGTIAERGLHWRVRREDDVSVRSFDSDGRPDADPPRPAGDDG